MLADTSPSLMVVVTINTSVKPQQFLGMLHKVKKQVSLQPGGRACYAEPRRRKTELSRTLGAWLGVYAFTGLQCLHVYRHLLDLCLGNDQRCYFEFSWGF